MPLQKFGHFRDRLCWHPQLTAELLCGYLTLGVLLTRVKHSGGSSVLFCNGGRQRDISGVGPKLLLNEGPLEPCYATA